MPKNVGKHKLCPIIEYLVFLYLAMCIYSKQFDKFCTQGYIYITVEIITCF